MQKDIEDKETDNKQEDNKGLNKVGEENGEKITDNKNEKGSTKLDLISGKLPLKTGKLFNLTENMKNKLEVFIKDKV